MTPLSSARRYSAAVDPNVLGVVHEEAALGHQGLVDLCRPGAAGAHDVHVHAWHNLAADQDRLASAGYGADDVGAGDGVVDVGRHVDRNAGLKRHTPGERATAFTATAPQPYLGQVARGGDGRRQCSCACRPVPRMASTFASDRASA